MKTYILLAFTFVASVACVKANDDTSLKDQSMKTLGELKEFFGKDPLGQKMAAVCKEVRDFFQILGTKARSALKEYAKRLMSEVEGE